MNAVAAAASTTFRHVCKVSRNKPTAGTPRRMKREHEHENSPNVRSFAPPLTFPHHVRNNQSMLFFFYCNQVFVFFPAAKYNVHSVSGQYTVYYKKAVE